jgi:hypothetical protein
MRHLNRNGRQTLKAHAKQEATEKETSGTTRQTENNASEMVRL